MEFWVIALLFAGAVLGNSLMVWAFRKSQKFEADLKALAVENGWRFRKEKSDRTRQGFLELAEAESSWSLRVCYGGGTGRSSVTIWKDAALGIPSGVAVYAPPLPEKTQMMINMMMDKSGGLGRVLLDSVFKGLGPEARELRAIEDDDPATLMATPGAEDAFDPLKGLAELSQLNQFGTNVADVPFLLRNADGLSMRINKRLKSATDIRDFIRVAQLLAAKF